MISIKLPSTLLFVLLSSPSVLSSVLNLHLPNGGHHLKKRATASSCHRSRKHPANVQHHSKVAVSEIAASTSSAAPVKADVSFTGSRVEVTFSSTSMTTAAAKTTTSQISTPTTTSVPSSDSSSASSSGGRTIGQGLFGIVDATCGPSKADESSPNGHESWLDCGITQSDPYSGWTPPFVSIKQVKTVTLEQALSQGSTFSACGPYVKFFSEYGNQYGIPPIFLASFAMQESSCNPSVVGDNGGAFGLMQITEDKCGSAPGGDCADPAYNVQTAAKYFADTLAANGGSLLEALGTYNGWFPSMTYEKANRIRSECCQCVNNLD